MRICSRPRTSSSVTREIRSSQIDFSRSKYVNYSENQNQDSNKFENNETKKFNPNNTQRRKLQPPNFNISYKVESISKNYKPILNQSNFNDMDSNLSIKKTKSSLIKRRSCSETRQKRENNSFQNNSNDKKNSKDRNNLKNKNNKISHLYASSKNQEELSKSSNTLKMSSSQNEFKNSDGSIKKISEKFRCLSTQNASNDDDDDFHYQSAYSSNIYKYFPPKLSDSHISDYSISYSELSKVQEDNNNTRTSTITNGELIMSKEKNDNNDRKNENLYNSIEIAMNRIKKEINEKEPKPIISKRKRSDLKEKKQISKSIDFEFLNDEQLVKEDANKSSSKKPHVSFMSSIQPPKKKNNDELKSNDDDDENQPLKDFNENVAVLPDSIVNKSNYRSKKESQKPPQNQEIDEFIQMENKMKDEVDDDKGGVIPNFLKIIKILRDQLDKSQYQEVIRIMNKNKSKHFLLLLSQPLMNIDGVYTMRGDLKFASLLWGYGPEKVTKEMIDQFYKYNVTTKLFDDQQNYNFEPNLDAISLMKKY